ncbi:unnamed protein product, partial [Thelazia callipaeda]|uniref:DCAF15_WD40 domain-containing protein n=1 Tax=Thelazia callipaeda TaxID=103827 RepID=A0A0N5D4Q5_THECL
MIDGTSGSSNNNNNDNNLDKDGSICDNEGSSELIQCKPDKIFPLDNEKEEDLHYPITTYHYSVSNNARYVYVIGEESNETNSQLFVWDLHRGTSRRYTLINLPLAAQLKHLYEINSQDGMLLSRNLQCFFVHLIQFNHSKQLIEVHDVLYRQHINHSHFWSSARISSGQGIIFMSQHNISRNFFIAKVIPNAPVQSVFLTAQMAGLHFCGQPWVHGDFMYLFESTSSINFAEIKYLTGRLVRANLTTGELEMIHTKATGFIKDSLPSMKEDINLLLEDENANIPFSLREMEHTTIIRRVKHVERSGWLWIIAEFMDSFSTYNSINSHCE